MNGRIDRAETPEARLAAVVVSVLKAIPEETWWHLDYADFEKALKPYVKRELLHARLEELRDHRVVTRDRLILHETRLFQELMEIEKLIASVPLETGNDEHNPPAAGNEPTDA